VRWRRETRARSGGAVRGVGADDRAVAAAEADSGGLARPPGAGADAVKTAGLASALPGRPAVRALRQTGGGGITAIHRESVRRWTVETLAIEVGMSRAGFAARFSPVGRRRPNRVSHALVNAARWTQFEARRIHRRDCPLTRV